MKQILVRGPVLSNSGYGVHSRQIARWLIERGSNVTFQVLPWGDTSWLINSQLENGLIGEIFKRTNFDPNKKYDISFQIQLPNEWDTNLAHTNIGITAGVETDRCNPEWIKNVLSMSKVIVPSEFTKKSFTTTSSLVDDKICVIPESFDDEYKNENPNQIDLRIKTKFNFLIFGQLTGNNVFNDRKNIFYTLKWLCESFKNDPDVGIILKTNSGKFSKIDKAIVTNVFKKSIEELQKGEFPKIHLLHGFMNQSEINSLYRHNNIKALISLTRGEGYGLPLLEAASAGVPIIATNWSGHLEFLNKIKFIGVDYNLEPVHQSRIDNRIFMNGSKWAQVSEEDFKRKIKKFKSNHSLPTQWAKESTKKIHDIYKFDSIVQLYEDQFKDLV